MKYLYPYECEKRRLSTPAELQAAIDGNRREGRRTSYGSYTDMIQRGPLPGMPPAHHSQMSPLSLVTSGRAAVNGNSHHHHHHHHHPHHPHHPQPLSQPLGTGPIPGLVASELENRMAEYVKMIHKEFRGSAATPPSIRQGSNSPPTSTSPQESALSVVEMSRLTLWNLYGNGAAPPAALPPPPEPQREALDLGVREQQSRAAPRDTVVKREREEPRTAPPAKRVLADEDEGLKPITGTHIKIASRGDARSGSDNSLVVSMELNGTMYQGVLFAQTTRTHVT